MGFYVSSSKNTQGLKPGMRVFVHHDDRAALIALHKATGTVRNAIRYNDAIQHVLDNAMCSTEEARMGRFDNLEYLLPPDVFTAGNCDLVIAFNNEYRVTDVDFVSVAIGHNVTDSIGNFSFEMEEMPLLEKFGLYGIDIPSSSILSEFIMNCFPGLKKLHVLWGRKSSAPFITDDIYFPNTLNLIRFEHYKIDESQLETLLFNVWPRFPHIEDIILGVESINSFQFLRRRLQKSKEDCPLLTSGMHRLLLCDDQRCDFDSFMKKETPADILFSRLFKDPEEVAAVRELLLAVPSLVFHTVGKDNPIVEKNIWPVNHANVYGQSLVVGKHIGRRLPLSVWPMAMARRISLIERTVDDRAESHATSLFYLLRNGPIFAGHVSTNNCHRKKHATVHHATNQPSPKRSKA